MANQDLYEVVFEWPHPEPTFVIVTGTFDEWSRSIHLTKTPTGFVGSTKIPWGEKIKFKYIVDNQWALHEDQITETDPGGFVNHTFTAPPAPHTNVETSDSTSNGHAALQNGLHVEETLKENGTPVVAENGEQAITLANAAGSEQVLDTPPVGLPQILSNIAETIVARDGTFSALEYVTSGLGAAIHNVVGVDPINTPQIAIPTPVADASFPLPGEEEPNSGNAVPHDSEDYTAVESEPSPHSMAPTIPLLIVPVNVAENNSTSGNLAHASEDQVLEPLLPSVTQGGDKEDVVPPAAEPADRSNRETVSNPVDAAVEPVSTLHGEGRIVEQAADNSESASHASKNPQEEPVVPESEPIKGAEADVALPLIEDNSASSQILAATGNSMEVHVDTEATEMQASGNTGFADHNVPASSEEATLLKHAADATPLEPAVQIDEAIPDSAEVTVTETNGNMDTDLITPNIPISLPDAMAGKDRIQTDFVPKYEVPKAETRDHTSTPELSVQHTLSDMLQVNEAVEVIPPTLTSMAETQVDPVRANTDMAPNNTSPSSPLSTPVTEPVPKPPTHDEVSISQPVSKATITQAFPLSSESPTASSHNSPSPSRVNTMRKKRTSIFGKIKHILHLDEKDKTKK